MLGDSVLLCENKPEAKVGEPFLELVRGAIGEPSAEFGKAIADFRCVDDDAFDWSVKDDLGREGVKSHLVRRLELREVVRGRGDGGGFVVFDEEVGVVGDDAVEVTAEEVVGLGVLWTEVKLEAKALLDRRGSVGED